MCIIMWLILRLMMMCRVVGGRIRVRLRVMLLLGGPLLLVLWYLN